MAEPPGMVNRLLTALPDDPALENRLGSCVVKIHRNLTAALLVASALALGGCQSKNASLGDVDSMATGSTGEPSLRGIANLGAEWEKDKGNAKLGLAYAAGLGSIGQREKRLEVLKAIAVANPKEPRLLNIYGKALAEAGHSKEAESILGRAAVANTADWKTLSALGSAYDQQGKYTEARAQYTRALQASPDNISVLNNLGMSYALEGDLPKAEGILKQAAAMPGAAGQPRLAQNLSLVVGLQGRFDEAREIASKNLPPQQVEENMAYLQKMLAQPDTWQQLKNG
jgi:Flp pilus assembly protein TadD